MPEPTRADRWIDRQMAQARAGPPSRYGPTTLWDWIAGIERSRAAGDPWYETASKAIIGDEDYQRVARGEIGPWVSHLSPFIITGGRGLIKMGPDMPVRVPTLTMREMELSPETRTLLDAVRSYEPPTAVVADPFAPAVPMPPKFNRIPPEARGDTFNYKDLPYAPRPTDEPPKYSYHEELGLPVPPGSEPTYFPYKMLPYAERPPEHTPFTGKDIELPPTEKSDLTKMMEDFFGGDEEKAKGMADAIKGMYEDYYNEHGWPPGMEPKTIDINAEVIPPPESVKPGEPLTPEQFYMLQDLGIEPMKVDPNFAMDAWDYYLKFKHQLDYGDTHQKPGGLDALFGHPEGSPPPLPPMERPDRPFPDYGEDLLPPPPDDEPPVFMQRGGVVYASGPETY